MRNFRSAAGAICKWCWRLVVIGVLFLNLRLYAPTPLVDARNGVSKDLLQQLAANRSAIDAGAPARMQLLFPEGFYFCHLFHGLAWVEVGLRDSSYVDEAIAEAKICLAKLESEPARAAFPQGLPPERGMFYSAWKCSLQAGLVLLQNAEDAEQLKHLRQECNAVAAVLRESQTPFPPSYGEVAWPCDSVPAIHAMCVCDHLTGESEYDDLIQAWLIEVQDRLDPLTGLIPHIAKLPDGRKTGVARATSQVIMLRMLPDIDPEFAREQYARFREKFFTTFLGAPCVLEFPSGTTGPGDVDSGPLIFGRSLSATVFIIGVAQIYGDQEFAEAVAHCGESIGVPWTSDEKKKYAAGVLPVGSIMVTYAQVARPWLAETEHCPELPWRIPAHWRWPIHALSLLVFIPSIVAILGIRLRAMKSRNPPKAR